MKQSYAQRTEDLHIDPLHVSTTFLNATSVKTPYQIKVHALKRGRSVTHLEVQFCQPVRPVPQLICASSRAPLIIDAPR